MLQKCTAIVDTDLLCSFGPDMSVDWQEGKQWVRCDFLTQAEQEAPAHQLAGEEGVLA